jgi:hypothetical protein
VLRETKGVPQIANSLKNFLKNLIVLNIKLGVEGVPALFFLLLSGLPCPVSQQS